tara:strand:- start:850 stop:1158 length:309 start_codon:yes stop_codon:yes gene_type:complete
MIEDPNVKKLSKLLSFEFMAWAIAMSAAFGVGYQSLASDVRISSEKINKLYEEQDEFHDDISEIKVNQARASAEQSAQSRQIAELKDTVNRILDLLQKNYDR